MMNKIAYRVLTEMDEVASISMEWDALLQRSPCNRAFSSPSWFLAACTDSQVNSAYVITAWRGSRLCGVLPLAITGEGRTASFPTYLADYNDIIAASEDSAVVAGLLRRAISTSGGYDNLLLTDLRPDSNCVRALSLILPAKNPLVPDYSACPHVKLPPTYREYLRTRTRAFQTRLKRAAQKAAKNGLTILELQPESFSPNRLPDAFLSLHLSRCGSASCFSRQHEQSFVAAALPALFELRTVRAFALFEKDKMVGINICMLGSESLCYWNSGFLAEAGHCSPGRLLIDAGINQAFVMGLKEYDLLRGSEDYKAGWANSTRQLYRTEISTGVLE
jgi:CelD/BcsL family acetyltransferase involved in cellulose biosynthesis